MTIFGYQKDLEMWNKWNKNPPNKIFLEVINEYFTLYPLSYYI